MDLVEGDKLVADIDEKLSTLEFYLARPFYTVTERWDPNFVGNKGSRLIIPQFSDAQNNLLETQRDLIKQKADAISQMRNVADKFVPTKGGPNNPSARKYYELVDKYKSPRFAPKSSGASDLQDGAAAGVTDRGTKTVQIGPDADTPLVVDAVGSAASVAKTKTVTKAEVDVALASSGLADTPANRKQIREGLKAGTKTEANWETLVAEQAGEYAYLLDPQYEGVPELLRKAVKEGYFKSDEGLKQFVQELKQTGYYRNTSQRQQLFDKKTPADKRVAIELEVDKIRAEYGEIQFDQAGLEEVAGVAARNGASPVELGRLVYRAAFKRGLVAPDFTAPVAAKTALGGQDADRIRSIYRAYGQRADDQMISRILAGDSDPASGVVMTEDMLRTNLRDIAKISYSPFSDLLDRGVSIETIFSPYQNIAASILEKPRDQISLLTNDGVPTEFASALSGDKPKSLNDWISELKRNPKYNYQFTSAANAEVSSMVSTLEKAFGFRQ